MHYNWNSQQAKISFFFMVVLYQNFSVSFFLINKVFCLLMRQHQINSTYYNFCSTFMSKKKLSWAQSEQYRRPLFLWGLHWRNSNIFTYYYVLLYLLLCLRICEFVFLCFCVVLCLDIWLVQWHWWWLVMVSDHQLYCRLYF